jgi:hypothetical protein
MLLSLLLAALLALRPATGPALRAETGPAPRAETGPALRAEAGSPRPVQDATETFDALAALWEAEEHDWLERLGEARREGRYRIVLAERPTPAFVARFEAWAGRGEGRAELWLLTNVQDLELPEDEIRQRKARALARLRAAPEHAWLGELVPVIARERRWVGEDALIGFLDGVWRENESADVRVDAGFMLARRLESHESAPDRARARDVYERVAEAAPESVVGRDAARRAAELAAAHPVAGAARGRDAVLVGRVVASGAADARPPLALDPELVARCCPGARVVPETPSEPSADGTWGLAGAVVEVLAPAAADPEPREAVLALSGCRLAPPVVALPAGATLVVQNDDTGCFVLRSEARANEVPSVDVVRGAPRRVTLERAEVFAVRSDALAWTRAWVFVARSPFFAVTDVEGRFRIPGLPAGEYAVRVWHARWGEITARVTLEPGAAADARYVLGAEQGR